MISQENRERKTKYKAGKHSGLFLCASLESFFSSVWALTPWRRRHGFSIWAQPLDERILCLVQWSAELHWLVWHHRSSASLSCDWRRIITILHPASVLGSSWESFSPRTINTALRRCWTCILSDVTTESWELWDGRCWVLHVGERGKAAALRTGQTAQVQPDIGPNVSPHIWWHSLTRLPDDLWTRWDDRRWCLRQTS